MEAVATLSKFTPRKRQFDFVEAVRDRQKYKTLHAGQQADALLGGLGLGRKALPTEYRANPDPE